MDKYFPTGLCYFPQNLTTSLALNGILRLSFVYLSQLDNLAKFDYL